VDFLHDLVPVRSPQVGGKSADFNFNFVSSNYKISDESTRTPVWLNTCKTLRCDSCICSSVIIVNRGQTLFMGAVTLGQLHKKTQPLTNHSQGLCFYCLQGYLVRPLAKVFFATETTEKKGVLRGFSKFSVYSVATYARGQLFFMAHQRSRAKPRSRHWFCQIRPPA